jgi:hypothetical protein
MYLDWTLSTFKFDEFDVVNKCKYVNNSQICLCEFFVTNCYSLPNEGSLQNVIDCSTMDSQGMCILLFDIFQKLINYIKSGKNIWLCNTQKKVKEGKRGGGGIKSQMPNKS